MISSESQTATVLRRAARIVLSRQSLWFYCKFQSPDFYKDDRRHLVELCRSLQALYEGRIIRFSESDPWQIVDVKPTEPHFTCKKFMLNMPPQHGKTRTLVNFSTWVFGKNPKEKIITGSYNDSTAGDFSRYTRDTIQAESIDPESIIYRDVFPNTRIKKGNSGFEKWALENSHFSYLGVGVGGSVTSKGGTILMTDDPMKGADEALNENVLEKTWLWWSSTFASRVSAADGEPIEIVNMTRWSDKDVCGRILDLPGAKDWFILKMEAYNEATDEMLCPSMLSKKRYDWLKGMMYEQIFRANYHQETLEASGTLFPSSKLNRFRLAEYNDESVQAKLGYIDVADQGTDSLAFPQGRIFPGRVFIRDIVFTPAGVEVTLGRCAGEITDNGLDYVRIESNNQGKLFHDMLSQLVDASKLLKVANVQNKHTRIIMMAGFILKYFWFLHPDDIEPNSDYAKFMKEFCSYMADGSSKKRDAPDAAAGLAKFIRSYLPKLFEPEPKK